MDNKQLDLVLEYLNAEDEITQESVKGKLKTIGAIASIIGGIVITGYVFVTLIPVLAVLIAVLIIACGISNTKKQHDFEQLMKQNPEAKKAVENFAKATQTLIKSKNKDFKVKNISFDAKSLSADKKEIKLNLGIWVPDKPMLDDIAELVLRQNYNGSKSWHYDGEETEDEYVENNMNYFLDDFTSIDDTADNAKEIYELTYKKWPNLKKSHKTFVQSIEDLNDGYKQTTGSTFISIKLESNDWDDSDEEPAEVVVNGGLFAFMIIRYVDFKNLNLPEAVKNAVNAEIQKRTK